MTINEFLSAQGLTAEQIAAIVGNPEQSKAMNAALAKFEEGKSITEAALEGARIRLRPILMTAFAFILGTVPLAIASGSGAMSRQILGTVVIGGMLAATLIAVFLIPVTFYVIEKLAHRQNAEPVKPPDVPDPPAGN